MTKAEKVNLVAPRGSDPMAGLWPQAMLMQTVLQETVVDDVRADDIVDLIASLEWRKDRAREFTEAVIAKCDAALDAIAGSPAYKSLEGYIKSSCKKKTLKLPSGSISIRKAPVKAEVFDEKLLKVVSPECFYEHQPPVQVKLSKDFLKQELQKQPDGCLYYQPSEGERICVASLVTDATSMTVKAAPERHTGETSRVLEGVEYANGE